MISNRNEGECGCELLPLQQRRGCRDKASGESRGEEGISGLDTDSRWVIVPGLDEVTEFLAERRKGGCCRGLGRGRGASGEGVEVSSIFGGGREGNYLRPFSFFCMISIVVILCPVLPPPPTSVSKYPTSSSSILSASQICEHLPSVSQTPYNLQHHSPI